MLNIIKKLIIKIMGFLGLIDFNNNKEETIYQLKPIMTNYEKYFYDILKELNDEYVVIPQLNLASVVKKINNNRYYSELFRNIDFAIFSKNYSKLLLLIEINDKTHNTKKRKERDLKVKKICDDINIKLITFYSNYPNEKNYVIDRVKNNLVN